MKNTKSSIVVLVVFLLVFSRAQQAQDNPPDHAAIVASFKQKIQVFLQEDNSRRGVEHAKVLTHEVKTPAPALHATKKFVHKKDGTPCGVKNWGCHFIWVDDSGAQYLDSDGKPCDPARYPETCHVQTAAAKSPVNAVWWKFYVAKVSDYSFDVKVTDSLVTPYSGVLSYTVVTWRTEDHPTNEEAEKDNNFTSSWSDSVTHTFGYQDGQWKLLK
jgi:hypothetical protein